jgi:hypothetical protein
LVSLPQISKYLKAGDCTQKVTRESIPLFSENKRPAIKIFSIILSLEILFSKPTLDNVHTAIDVPDPLIDVVGMGYMYLQTKPANSPIRNLKDNLIDPPRAL